MVIQLSCAASLMLLLLCMLFASGQSDCKPRTALLLLLFQPSAIFFLLVLALVPIDCCSMLGTQ